MIIDKVSSKKYLWFIYRAIFYLLIILSSSGCYYLMAEEPYLKKSQRAANTYISKHPELSERKKDLIHHGKIDVSFTKEEVKLSYNYVCPSKIKRLRDCEANEIWIYHRWVADESLYFKDDKLIKIDIVPKDVK